MNTSAQLVVFDCDGTLVDSRAMILEAMRRAALSAGVVPASDAAVMQRVGLPLREVVVGAFTPRDAATADALVEGYKRAFRAMREGGETHEPLFEGARRALDSLREQGVAMGVATGKSMRGLASTVALHDLGPYFCTLQSNDGVPGKPDPTMLRLALREGKCAPQHAVMVGDTTYDIVMAGNADVAAIGVSWGSHTPDALRAAGARVVIDRFDQLDEAIATCFA